VLRGGLSSQRRAGLVSLTEVAVSPSADSAINGAVDTPLCGLRHVASLCNDCLALWPTTVAEARIALSCGKKLSPVGSLT